MYQSYAMHLSFYPPIPYFQVLDHSVTAGVVNMIFFIITPVSATHWRIFIHICMSFLLQDWRRFWPHFFPLFRRLWSWLRKYLAGVMMWSAWLSLTMSYSSLSVFIFVQARDALMPCTQAVSLSCGMNTRTEPVWMSQPRHVLRLASWTSPTSLRSERGSYHFRGFLGCQGLNMVWMINKAAFSAHSTQCGLPMVMVMMSSMNTSIEASFA